MIVLSAADIAARLPWQRLIAALGRGIGEAITSPPRHYHYPDDGRDLLLIMPAWSARWMGVKSIGVFPDIAGVAASYLLIDRDTGGVAAVLDGLELTNRRTAAASALAAQALVRSDAGTLLVMGTGGLAGHVAAAHASVRDYRRILIWGRDPAKSAGLAARLRADGLPAEAVVDAEAAVRQADVVSCVTGARAPILNGAWLQPGTHVDLIGAHEPQAREADSDAIAGALVYADVRANVLREAGDIIIPIAEGRITADAVRGELVDLVGRTPAEMRGAGDITLFKSVGFAAEDMIAATTALGVTA